MATKVQTKTDSKKAVIQTVSISSTIKSMILTSATSAGEAEIKVAQSSQTIIRLGDMVRQELGKNPYEVTRLSIKPLFDGAYKTANDKLAEAHKKDPTLPAPRDEKTLALRTGEQLARMMAIAYPGGADASPEKRKRALANLETGRKAGLSSNNMLLASKLKLMPNKKGEFVKVEDTAGKPGSGGANKVKPIDAYTKGLTTLLSAAKSAKLTVEQLLNRFSDVLVELEMIEDGSELAGLLND